MLSKKNIMIIMIKVYNSHDLFNGQYVKQNNNYL